jgi:hypothetical protein
LIRRTVDSPAVPAENGRTRATVLAFALAVVVTVDFFNFVPSPFFAAVGLLILGSSAVAGDVIGRIAGPLLAVLAAASVGSVLAWRYRRRLAAAAATVLGRLERTVRRLVPGLDRRKDLEFRRRATTLLEQPETVAARRRTLAALLLCGVTGWALLSLGLWLSLYAVGVVVPLGVTLFAVPLATVTADVPVFRLGTRLAHRARRGRTSPRVPVTGAVRRVDVVVGAALAGDRYGPESFPGGSTPRPGPAPRSRSPVREADPSTGRPRGPEPTWTSPVSSPGSEPSRSTDVPPTGSFDATGPTRRANNSHDYM